MSHGREAPPKNGGWHPGAHMFREIEEVPKGVGPVVLFVPHQSLQGATGAALLAEVRAAHRIALGSMFMLLLVRRGLTSRHPGIYSVDEVAVRKRHVLLRAPLGKVVKVESMNVSVIDDAATV